MTQVGANILYSAQLCHQAAKAQGSFIWIGDGLQGEITLHKTINFSAVRESQWLKLSGNMLKMIIYNHNVYHFYGKRLQSYLKLRTGFEQRKDMANA